MKTLRCILLLSFTFAPTSFGQQLHSTEYSTSGKPSSVLLAPDGEHLLVSEVNADARHISAVQVFSLRNGKLHSDHLIPLGSEAAQGMVLIPHTRTVAVGLSDNGIGFFSLDDAIAGKAELRLLQQGDRPGSGYLAATQDGKYLFVANEYARSPAGGVGSIGVIALNPSPDGTLHPRTITQAPAGNTTPGVAISPDGSRVYSVAEVFPLMMAEHWAGANNPDLHKEACKQGTGRTMRSGGLYIWNAAKLVTLNPDADLKSFRGAIVNGLSAGCSPVRIAVTADGKRLYTTARGDNKVLEFDADRLESDAEHALLRVLPTEGNAPVGLALFNNDKSLLVANSNRFNGGTGNATVIDLATGKVIQKINTGEFPRNITVSPDGRTLYLSNFVSGSLQVLTMQ